MKRYCNFNTAVCNLITQVDKSKYPELITLQMLNKRKYPIDKKNIQSTKVNIQFNKSKCPELITLQMLDKRKYQVDKSKYLKIEKFTA